MSKVVDNLNRPVAEGGIVITLRSDATGGVSLGGDESIEPGETRRLPAHLALPLLQSGKAVRAVVDEPMVADAQSDEGQKRGAPPEEPEVSEVPSPLVPPPTPRKKK